MCKFKFIHNNKTASCAIRLQVFEKKNREENIWA